MVILISVPNPAAQADPSAEMPVEAIVQKDHQEDRFLVPYNVAQQACARLHTALVEVDKQQQALAEAQVQATSLGEALLDELREASEDLAEAEED